MTLENDQVSEAGEVDADVDPSGAGDDGGASVEAQIASDPEVIAKFEAVFGASPSAADDATEAPAAKPARATPETTSADANATAPKQPAAAPITPKASAKAAPAPTQEGAAAKAASTLSPALVQAAKRNGWGEQEISEFVTGNPDLAERTFAKLHEAYNSVSADFARIGQALTQQASGEDSGGERAAAGRQQAPAKRQAANAPAAESAAAEIGVKAEDIFSDRTIRGLRESQGDDFVDQFVMPLKTHVIERINQVIEGHSRLMADLDRRESESLGREVNGIFQGWEGDYADLYGKNGAKFSAEQQEARAKVCQMADWMMAGASRTGVELSVSDALDRAHHYLTKDRTAANERKKLLAGVTKRQGQFTMRPSQRQGGAGFAGRSGGAGNSTDAAAMEAYAQKAAELGLSL